MMQKWFEILKESYEEYQVLNTEKAKDLALKVFKDIENTHHSKGTVYGLWVNLTSKIEPDREKRLAWMEIC